MRHDETGTPAPNGEGNEPPATPERKYHLYYQVDAEGNKSDEFLLDDIPELSPVGRDIIRKKLEGLGIAPEKIEAFMRNVK